MLDEVHPLGQGFPKTLEGNVSKSSMKGIPKAELKKIGPIHTEVSPLPQISLTYTS